MNRKVNRDYLVFYVSRIRWLIGLVFGGIGLIGCTIVVVLFFNSELTLSALSFDDNALDNGTALNYYLPYFIPGLISIIFFIVGSVALISYYFKKNKIIQLLENTQPVKAVVVKNIQNFYVQVNNVPRREVTFQTQDGSTHMFKFFSEHLASVLRQNTELDIVIHKNKAYPAPEFYDKIFDPNQPTRKDVRSQMNDAQDNSFKKFIDGAEKFKKSGDIEAAISFYESALSFKEDPLAQRKLIDLYKKNGQSGKADALRNKMHS